MEFFSPQFQVLQSVTLQRPNTDKPPQAAPVMPVTPMSRRDNASPHDGTLANSGNGQGSSLLEQFRQALASADRPAGPPPAFEVSILDQQRDSERETSPEETSPEAARQKAQDWQDSIARLETRPARALDTTLPSAGAGSTSAEPPEPGKPEQT